MPSQVVRSFGSYVENSTNGIRGTSVAIVAVFDGHNGAEASEMASKMLLEYFTLHTFLLLDTAFPFLSNISKGIIPNKGDMIMPLKYA
ncbi:putative protein phosphatase 2C family, PPM-type phosphatase domain superfamily [Helianthus anomalus]